MTLRQGEIKQERDKVIIQEFHRLLRSGKDYSIYSMHDEAGRKGFVSRSMAQLIINRYYRALITRDMIQFICELRKEGPIDENSLIGSFSYQFNLCERESRMMITYINKRKDE